LFAAIKQGWGLKEAWQQSRQALMRWVTILAAGYALSQMLAYADPACIPGLAAPAPWRRPATCTAGLIRAGLSLRSVVNGLEFRCDLRRLRGTRICRVPTRWAVPGGSADGEDRLGG
jgi:hypothetical protein